MYPNGYIFINAYYIIAHSIKQAVKNKNDELFTPKILVESLYVNLLKN